jgi:hypothetical protein
MIQKYLFLDIDGVLNSREVFIELYKPRKPAVEPLGSKLVARVNRLVRETGCKVVLSSVWRFSGLEAVQKKLDAAGVQFKLIGMTPRDYKDRQRGNEIQMYIDEHNITADQIVILDDDSDMVHLLPRLVHTTFEKGLQDHHVEEAIALFE